MILKHSLLSSIKKKTSLSFPKYNNKFYSTNVPPKLHQIGRLNHVAIAVPNIESSASFYKDVLGANVSSVQELPDHGVKTVFVRLENTNIELLEPLGENSPISKFLQKKPSGGMHHICLEVDDIESSIEHLIQQGVKPIDPKPKIGAHGKPVVFLNPKDCNGVLVELEQK